MTEFDLTPPSSAQRDAIIAGLTAEEHDVEAQRREAGLAQRSSQDVARQYVGVDRSTLALSVRLAREYQAARCDRTRELPAPQLRNEVRGLRDRSHAALGLRGRLLAAAGCLALDEEPLALEVDRFPREAAHFTRAQPPL